MGNVISHSNVCVCHDDSGCKDCYQPLRSYSVCFGLGSNGDPRTSKLLCADMSARCVSSDLIDMGIIPRGNAVVVLQSSVQNDCTYNGMKQRFMDQAKKVCKNGLFVFVFSGHSTKPPDPAGLVSVIYEEKGEKIKDACPLVTGRDLCVWLKESKCEAKYKVFILDCCYAEAITSEIREYADKGDFVYTLASCTADEQSVTVPALGCTTFCYCLSHALRSNTTKPGQFPIGSIVEACKRLTTTLSSLLVSTTVHGELFDEVMHPSENRISADGESVNFYAEFLKLLKYDNLLHIKSVEWLKGSIDHLNILKAEGILDDNPYIVNAILCSMLYSVANLQTHYDLENAGSPYILVAAYLRVVETIQVVYPDVVFCPPERALKFYITVPNRNIKGCTLRQEFDKLIKSNN